MKKILISLTILILIALPMAAQTKEISKAQKNIEDIAIKWQDTWNRHDMKALAALVATDVDFISVAGVRQKSSKELEQFLAELHQTQFKESVWTTKKTEVKLIKPDVALTHVEWEMKNDNDPDGTLRQPRQGIFTWVLEKQKGAWLIIAAQNTNIRKPVPSK